MLDLKKDRGLILYQPSQTAVSPCLQGLFNHTNPVLDLIKAQVPTNAEVALVFGSYARHQLHQKSDIDVLLLGPDLSVLQANALMIPVGEHAQRDIHVTVFSIEDWTCGLNNKLPLHVSILSNPCIVLKGQVRWLELSQYK